MEDLVFCSDGRILTVVGDMYSQMPASAVKEYARLTFADWLAYFTQLSTK